MWGAASRLVARPALAGVAGGAVAAVAAVAAQRTGMLGELSSLQSALSVGLPAVFGGWYVGLRSAVRGAQHVLVTERVLVTIRGGILFRFDD